jgi:hypothetical protein
MSNKRYRSRREWHNTVLMLWSTPFLVLLGVIIFASTGRNSTLWAISLGCLVGIVVAVIRDIGNGVVYTLEGGRLVLQSRRDREVVPLTEVMDVSLIDRAGAREYIISRLHKEGHRGLLDQRRAARRFIRFASVDIGLTSYTLGLGRRMIDRMPDARKDLVLLRLRNDKTHILSPEYNQELISAIGRKVFREEAAQE